jgi:hypothetical protein
MEDKKYTTDHPKVRVVHLGTGNWRTEVQDDDGQWYITGPPHNTKLLALLSVNEEFVRTHFEVIEYSRKFMLSIDMENAAFSDPAELPRLLREIADSPAIASYHVDRGVVADVNGNTVGEWRMT